jgi:hypothetical protein
MARLQSRRHAEATRDGRASLRHDQSPYGCDPRLWTVAAEMALHVLAYNLTRVMNIVGKPSLIAAIRPI